MKTVEKLGIYGGTFSPIHNGHIRAAEKFLSDIDLDRLLIMPAAIPPHKAADGVSGEDRLEMARIAFEGADPRLEVCDFEVRREGRSYTINTLEHFTSPDRRIYMLVGTDMFLTLPEWRRAEDIFRLADIVLMRRERLDETGRLIAEKKLGYERDFGARIHIIDEEPLEMSSTELREKLRRGEPVDKLIPDGVARYIREKKLYTEG